MDVIQARIFLIVFIMISILVIIIGLGIFSINKKDKQS